MDALWLGVLKDVIIIYIQLPKRQFYVVESYLLVQSLGPEEAYIPLVIGKKPAIVSKSCKGSWKNIVCTWQVLSAVCTTEGEYWFG